MQQAAIYVRDPLPTTGSIISNEGQETACRDYCQGIGLTVSATFMDTAGTRNEFKRMISEAMGWDAAELTRLRELLHQEPHVRGLGYGQYGDEVEEVTEEQDDFDTENDEF